MARIIVEVRPRLVYVENSPLLVGRGLALVLGDLTEMGYDAQWCIVSASDVGAPHQRDRCWLVAHDNGTWQPQHAGQQQERRMGPECGREAVANTCPQGLPAPREKPNGKDLEQIRRVPASSRRWPTEPGMGRVADGVAHRVDRIKALGNGQVPRVAATAFPLLSIDND
ncbi:DNA cytosine methyltransferase [Pseudomonas veronii]|uniref:DNA cytosine methyltransferase n=1 Tax=Pseudomonas veronii TaxID=76761 RepID=UPI001EE74948|nr:DNA cytosine methyltransferase [Pseudomonas veronii]